MGILLTASICVKIKIVDHKVQQKKSTKKLCFIHEICHIITDLKAGDFTKLISTKVP